MNTHHDDTGYIPGQCNIGPGEIRKRKRIGLAGLFLMVLFILAAELFHFPDPWKLLLVFPAAYACSGFLQMRQHFCLIYGLFGWYSFGTHRTKVKDNESASKDLKKALWIITQVLLLSCLITLMYYFISQNWK